MVKPEPFEKASLVATLAAGVMASPEAWRAYEHEADGKESFEEWAIRRGKKLAFQVWKDCNE